MLINVMEGFAVLMPIALDVYFVATEKRGEMMQHRDVTNIRRRKNRGSRIGTLILLALASVFYMSAALSKVSIWVIVLGVAAMALYFLGIIFALKGANVIVGAALTAFCSGYFLQVDWSRSTCSMRHYQISICTSMQILSFLFPRGSLR